MFFFLNSNWKCNCMNKCSFLFYLWNYSKFQKNYGSSCYKYTNKQICKFVKQFHYFNEKYQDISAIRPGICNCNIMKKYPGFMHFFINFMKIWQNDLVINTKDFLILTEWFCYFNERILSYRRFTVSWVSVKVAWVAFWVSFNNFLQFSCRIYSKYFYPIK